MSTFQIFLLAFLISAGMIFTGILTSALIRVAIVGGMKEMIIMYLDKKKEAIAELEKQFAKSGTEEPGPQRWTA